MEKIKCDLCDKIFEGKSKYSNYYGLLYWVNNDGKIVGMKYNGGLYTAYACRECLEKRSRGWFETWRRTFES